MGGQSNGFISNGRNDNFVKTFNEKMRQVVRVPVSYTHLDVYKRQEWGRCKTCQYINSPDEDTLHTLLQIHK